MKRYLFSPVGMTDPIKYQKDGSMLHICRVYQPDVVILYMSQEILALHRKDNRYVATLELLGQKLHHNFDCRVISREGLVEAHQYDVFYQEFHDIISKIEHEMEPGDELFLNMASGTPAMKSALLTLSVLAEYRFTPVQVGSPKHASNLEHEERKDYDIQINWELDEDNEEDFENRTSVIQCGNLMTMLKKDILKKHLEAYDYAAARQVGKEIRDSLDDESYAMLCMAVERSNLNLEKVDQYARKYHWKLYAVTGRDKRELHEYALSLQNKLRKGEYADFIRAITPLLMDLLERLLQKTCGINIRLYYNKRGEWDANKLNGSEILDILNRSFTNGFRYGNVYSNQLIRILDERCTNSAIVSKADALCEVEQKLRNPAAHEIISVTDMKIKAMTGYTAIEIMGMIRFLFDAADIAGMNMWDSYDRMNEMITDKLDL